MIAIKETYMLGPRVKSLMVMLIMMKMMKTMAVKEAFITELVSLLMLREVSSVTFASLVMSL